MSSQLSSKAKKIKAIITDVDGVLTDGGIIYDNDYKEYKRYNVKDGQIISHLKRLGFIVGAITGRESDVVKKRMQELKFTFHHHGVKDKLVEYEKIKQEYKLKDEEIAYIGDDIIDLSILCRCGLSATPQDAREYIKNEVDYVTVSKGGEGVFRDVSDMILEEQNLINKLIEEMKGCIK
jgi:3-deoxy-D-manno-octulosonate 8-phosphate phosphatase (KDO 8-P phosphatase)